MIESHTADTTLQSLLDNLIGVFADYTHSTWNRYLREIIAFVDNYAQDRAHPDESFMCEIEDGIVPCSEKFKFRLKIISLVAYYATSGQPHKIAHNMQPQLRDGIERYALERLSSDGRLEALCRQCDGTPMARNIAQAYLENACDFDEKIVGQLLAIVDQIRL